MTERRKWTAIPGLLALAIGAVMLSAYSGASSSQHRSPVQPIAFPHPVHVQKLGMNCLYCHNAANKSMDPGLPAVGTCIGCPPKDASPATNGTQPVSNFQPTDPFDVKSEGRRRVYWYTPDGD